MGPKDPHGPGLPSSTAGPPDPRPGWRRTLAHAGTPPHDAGMPHLLRGLDTVVWTGLTVLMVITGIALLGFVFLAAI